MEYNNQVTLNHPLAKHTDSLNKLSRKDGGEGLFNEDVLAISLDNAEHARDAYNTEKTMDIAIGTIRRGTSSKPRNAQMIMCEFRFNFKSVRNIKRTDLENKIKHSHQLLQNGYLGTINETSYFLFPDNLINQAKSLFNRLYNTRTQNRVVLTESQMSDLITSKDF